MRQALPWLDHQFVTYELALLEMFISPALHLTGKVVAGSGAGELHSLTVERGVPEEVAEVFKKLQKFVWSILENRNNFST